MNCGKKYRGQVYSVTRKNLISAWRNYPSTLAQLLVGLFFLILLLILKAAILAQGALSNATTNVPVRQPEAAPLKYPSCTSYFGECYAFGYASSRSYPFRNDEYIEQIVDFVANALNTSAERNVSGGILKFSPSASLSDVDDWILNNPNRTRGIIIFENSYQWNNSNSSFNYILQTNSTVDCQNIGVFKSSVSTKFHLNFNHQGKTTLKKGRIFLPHLAAREVG